MKAINLKYLNSWIQNITDDHDIVKKNAEYCKWPLTLKNKHLAALKLQPLVEVEVGIHKREWILPDEQNNLYWTRIEFSSNLFACFFPQLQAAMYCTPEEWGMLGNTWRSTHQHFEEEKNIHTLTFPLFSSLVPGTVCLRAVQWFPVRESSSHIWRPAWGSRVCGETWRQSSHPTQNFWVYSKFMSFFISYSRLLADFLSHLGKWVKLIKFEAENEFFWTWKVEKPQSTTPTP